MSNASAGHALHGRGKGLGEAVRFAVSENSVTGVAHEEPSKLFRVVAAEVEAEAVARAELPAAARAGRRDERTASSL
jgi:hypothetical protein